MWNVRHFKTLAHLPVTTKNILFVPSCSFANFCCTRIGDALISSWQTDICRKNALPWASPLKSIRMHHEKCPKKKVSYHDIKYEYFWQHWYFLLNGYNAIFDTVYNKFIPCTNDSFLWPSTDYFLIPIPVLHAFSFQTFPTFHHITCSQCEVFDANVIITIVFILFVPCVL